MAVIEEWGPKLGDPIDWRDFSENLRTIAGTLTRDELEIHYIRGTWEILELRAAAVELARQVRELVLLLDG